MRYATLGKTNLKISKMALGTWGIGGAGWDEKPIEERQEAIRAAIECGVNFIDTAPAYNAGMAEKHIGKVLEEMGCRDKVVISTKCGNKFVDGQYIRTCKTVDILQQIDDSRRNLRTDYIDIYLIHWPDPTVPFQETMDILNTLKAQGKIHHIGVSNFTKDQIEEAGKYAEIEVFQPQYSMVYRDNEEIIKWAHEQNIGVMTYGSLGGGMLTGKYREPRVYAPSDSRNRFYKHFQEPLFSKVIKVVEEMDKISAERGVPLYQIALNWASQKEFTDACIVGAQDRRHVEENAAAFEWQLTEEDMRRLDGISSNLLRDTKML